MIINENTNELESTMMGGKRTTALTGSSFGLFITLRLHVENYMGGGITQEVRLLEANLKLE